MERKPPKRPNVSEHATSLLLNTLLGVATKQPGHVSINLKDIRGNPTTEGALDANGTLMVHPAEFWRRYTQTEITYFCVQQGFYCIPTTELVEWLRERIAGRVAIEIGAGSGVLAAALGIPATDNRMQEWPEIRKQYHTLGQAPVPYGERVETLDAIAAIRKYKPDVVIGAWVTHKYRPSEPWRKGNEFGVEEIDIIRQVKMYIHIGHTGPHEAKPALEIPHAEYDPPWLVSRAMSAGRNYICCWGR